MTERPLCRDVSLAAAGECLVDAASYAAAALLDLRDAAGHALIALVQGPTMRSVLRPMPEPSAEAEARFAQMMAKARERDDADVDRRAHEAMAQRDALLERDPAPESVCVCGDYPVTVGEPCAACAVEAEMDAERAEVGA
jgi:hypothetical protein